VATQWRTEPRRLVQSLRGDLDWIVMKCLEKDRTRRYSTAAALAADIEHYLADEPVTAAAPSRVYRLKKFSRRHWAALSVGAAFVAILAATAVFSSIQWGHARKAEIAARQEGDEREKQRQRAVDAERTATQYGQRAEANAAEARRNLYTAHMQQAQLEWERSNLARVRELLAKYASPAPEQVDQRGWEWHYWTRMCEQELRTLKGHEGAVTAVAFNSDGSLVASAGQDGKLCIWNVGDGTLVCEIKAHENAATCLAFHGNTIATAGSDSTLHLWDASDGHELASFQLGNFISCVEFSGDGKLLAVGATSPRIIDVETLKEVHRLDTEREVFDLAFTKDGSQLVIASTPNLEYWDTQTGKLLRKTQIDELHENNLQYQATTALELSETGDYFVTANMDHRVHVRRFSDAEPTRTIRGHTGMVLSAALSPDEKVIASGGEDNTVILWNIDTGEEIRRLRGHEKQVRHVIFSPDGLRLASASDDGTVKIWDAVQPTDFRPFLTASKGHHMRAAFNHDGRLYAIAHISGPPVSPGNTFNKWVEVRDALTGMRASEFSGHHGWTDSIAFSHDGTKLATGARDGSIKFYDTASQRELYTLEKFEWPILNLAFSPNGRWLHVETPEVDEWRGRRRIEDLPWFGPDDLRQVALSEGIVSQQLWEVGTQTRIRTFPATSFAFHPREEICAVTVAENDKYAIDFYRTDRPLEGQAPFRSWKLDEAASIVRYDPRGKRMAATLGNQLVVWNDKDGRFVSSIPNAGNFVGFDESGERLFSRPTDRKLSVWRTDTGDLVCEITLPYYAAGTTVSRDGMRVAICERGFNHLLELRPPDDEVRKRLEARNLVAHMVIFPTQSPPFALHTKAELLKQVSMLATVSPAVRRLAAELIDDFYTPEEEAWQFGSHAEALILHADKTGALRQEGLKWSKAACEIVPELWEFQYGFALYRVGSYQGAFESIENSYAQMIEQYPRYVPRVLAVRAMAQFRVGMKEAAIETLAAAKTHPYSNFPESTEVVREAKSAHRAG
jgi:WD40 repeat protein